ncbi:autophagy protein 5 [Coprinopsis marcescibilis]|uniref:Autophagy protein 5 n=1 Tax=Coprinopsis marcescibilis TaxID=230819 RepID=A0A5C3KFS7_COPMA|nr:autophagy protein 5 [Coprinopsis marcescibilis]
MSAYGTTRQPPTAGSGPKDKTTDYHTALFRRLAWEGTVPIEIRVDPKELPANSDRGLECYYLQAPRVTYLPLLLPEIRRFLMDVVFDEAAASSLKEEDWWFETEEGTVMKWHWPIGLIYDTHTISRFVRNPTAYAASSSTATPLRLILHLASPPVEKLLLAPSQEACKQAFMGQIKEADFIRWGSTKRVTGLRKNEQDGIWEGIKDHNFDDYWRVASKVTPSASPGSSLSAQSSGHTRPGTDIGTAIDRDGAYSVRSIPARIYLPDGPVLQEFVSPLLEDGTPNTLGKFLSAHLSLLFPPRPPAPPPSRSNPNPQPPSVQELAYAMVQGVITPPESEMAWLGVCLAGADGWLNICIGINKV